MKFFAPQLAKYVLLSVFVFFFVFLNAKAQDSAGFSIQAENDTHALLTSLYDAMGSDGDLTFVTQDADVLVTSEAPQGALSTRYFLPDLALVLLSDNPDAQSFLDYAVSPDGQQVLIDLGVLPAVISVVDQAGNTVEVAQPIRRVVSPYALATFLVYAVDAERTLIAAGYLGTRDPAGGAAMERIDSRFPELNAYNLTQQAMSVEMVAELEPDVILNTARADWLDPIMELGIPIIRYEGESPDALKEAVRLTGRLFGPDAQYRAKMWVEAYDAVLAQVGSVAAALDARPRVLFTGTTPTSVASGEMYQSAMIEAAGGESVSAELTGYWNDVNLEQIVVWNPDVIFVPPYGGATVEAITENPDWQILDAVQNGRVYQVPKLVAPWDTPVQDSLLGILWMAERLHPDAQSLDCAGAAQSFYATFYDYAISDDIVEMLCNP